jgi:uncharacterized protein YciI
MRRALLLTLTTLFVPAVVGGQPPTPPGFETYLFGLLTRGSGALPEGETAASLQKAHLGNLNRMWEEGLLVASGPIGGDGDLRGVVIFRGDERSAVEKRIAEDPLIKSGRLRISLKPWMGPAGIGADYKKWSDANPGAADKMKTYQLVLMRFVPTAAPMTPAEQLAHLRNMDAMAKAGHLAMAGPILEPGDLAGVFVFDTAPAEAEKLAASDPAVASRKMTVERHAWMVAEHVIPKGFKVPLP